MSDAKARYEQAMTNIRRGLTVANGGQAAENAARVAYSALVREGLAPQLKMKYRKGKFLKQVR